MATYFITYQILQLFAIPLLFLYLFFRKINGKKVFGDIKERLGIIPRTNKGEKVVWFHAVSVGEVLSIQSIVELIKKTNPNTVCYLTVGTATGKKIAQEKLTVDHISFLPYDFLPCMLLAYNRINPTKLIVIEAEIWPNLLMLARLKKISTSLVNARISKRSKKKYHRFKKVLLPLFDCFESIYTQSDYDKKEFMSFGVEEKKLHVLGNIKASTVLKKRDKASCVKSTEKTLLVGSMHPGELDIYLNLYKKLKTIYRELKLIIAPRHFHWKDELVGKVKKSGFSHRMWDESTQTNNLFDRDILLVCKLGELFSLYPKADIYFLGGTFVPIGGHNLLEPAAWGVPTIIGPHCQNCAVTAAELVRCNGAIAVKNEKELEQHVTMLLSAQKTLHDMGKNARTWLEAEGNVVGNNIRKISTFS